MLEEKFSGGGIAKAKKGKLLKPTEGSPDRWPLQMQFAEP
jgi:hypothetical protein